MHTEEYETRQITRERYHAQIYVVNADASHDLLRLSGIDATLCAILLIRSSPVQENGEALTWPRVRPKAKALEVDRERERHCFDHNGPPRRNQGPSKNSLTCEIL